MAKRWTSSTSPTGCPPHGCPGALVQEEDVEVIETYMAMHFRGRCGLDTRGEAAGVSGLRLNFPGGGQYDKQVAAGGQQVPWRHRDRRVDGSRCKMTAQAKWG